MICDNPLNKKYGCGKRNITYMTVCLRCEEELRKKAANKEQTSITEEVDEAGTEEKAADDQKIKRSCPNDIMAKAIAREGNAKKNMLQITRTRRKTVT